MMASQPLAAAMISRSQKTHRLSNSPQELDSEVVRAIYEPGKIGYEDLLEAFPHDPTPGMPSALVNVERRLY